MSQHAIPPSKEPHRAVGSPPPEGPLFSARGTTLFRVALVALVFLATGASFMASVYHHSGYWNEIGFAPLQPVQFSHRHHAGELRIDCRFCHATVETLAFAGMPSTQTCMSCHSQIFTDSPMLQPVIESAARNVPMQWSRVTRLPDHVYFNHSIHVNRGVSCITCHGEVGNMPLIAKSEPLTMRWCLECHRNPGPRLGPAAEVFAATLPPTRSGPSSSELLRSFRVQTENLNNCSTCHH